MRNPALYRSVPDWKFRDWRNRAFGFTPLTAFPTVSGCVWSLGLPWPVRVTSWLEQQGYLEVRKVRWRRADVVPSQNEYPGTERPGEGLEGEALWGQLGRQAKQMGISPIL